jgi:5-methylthioadenosine/S-adenosylhomocysteine deaminase
MKQLIKNVHILTMDADYTEFKRGYLLIENKRIAAVGSLADLPADQFQADQIIDGRKGLLLPGFINTHTHIGMIPFRSLGDDVPDRLRRFLFPLEQFMTRELVAASSRYAIAEMFLSGVTSFCDMYYFEEIVAKCCQEMGARALVGETIIDQPTCDSPESSGGLAYCEKFLAHWSKDELVTPVIAPHAPNTNNIATLKEIIALSEHFSAPITMHVSEMTYEMTEFQEKYQQTPIEFLHDLGYFEREFIMAHCIFAQPNDLALISQSQANVRVAHCIGANTKSAKGVAPVKEMLAQGISVGLGTDGPSSGNTLDLFSQMRLFANFHKTHNQDRALFPAKEIVRLATRGGAEVLGLADKVGTIEVGKQADLTLVETESVNMFPIFDPYSALVYSANAGNVAAVWVNGRQVVKDKQLVDFSVPELRSALYQNMNTFVKEAKQR